MLRVRLDGKDIQVPDGSTIDTILPHRGPSQSVGILSPREVSRSETHEYLLQTTAGELVAEIVPGTKAGLILAEISGMKAGWQDLQVASFGPFNASFTPAKKPSRYERGDIVLGCGGYDPGRSYLILCRKTHAADHGGPVEGSVIARVISGRGLLDRLTQDDLILSVEPVISFAESSDVMTTNDSSTALKDGMHIISHIMVKAQGVLQTGYDSITAASVERMLLAMRESEFIVDQRISNHIRCDILAGTSVPFEICGPRREGTVHMRTRGKKQGSIYIYTYDLPRSLSHTLVGQVTHGLELCRIAGIGDHLSLVVEPVQFDLVGLSLSDAVKRADELNISLTPDKEGTDRIVIGQDPPTTMEALATGSVTVTTIADEKVISITLDDIKAPLTCRIFREVCGLKYHAVGNLPMLFSFDEVTLFKATIPKSTHVIPENTPVTTVLAGVLAMTNDSCRGVGIVGVRSVPFSEFGPTSEPFSGTNQIGVVNDMEKIAELEEGEQVYFREVRV